ATSREVLGLPGEKVWQIAPLAVPDADAPLAVVAASPAVQLFVERARAARADFGLDTDNADAVTRIVHSVDALPLGFELAAARIRAMGADVLAERLGQRRDVLDGAQTSAASRHRTLHDLASWSYELLDDEERALFARLSVFVGTFDL